MKVKNVFWLLTAAVAVLSACRGSEHVFQIDLIKYLDNSYTQSFETALTDGLQAAGLAEGRDYRIRKRSAQGEMSNLTMIIDAAAGSGSDLLILFQSPTLYAAISRAPDAKKAFTLLQNPFILGAGKSDGDHVKNLTGVYMVPALPELLDAVSQCRPEIKRLGTVYFAGNDDSIFRKDELIRIAAGKGMTVSARPYASQNEIPAAADALLSDEPQALIHLQDPAQDETFPALARAAVRKRIPVFSVVHNMEKLGASIAYSTDRLEVGRKFAALVAAIIKGADPSTMPFENDLALPKKAAVNRAAAANAGIELPASVFPAPDTAAAADRVLEGAP